jgi:hypothetical protein
MRFSLKDVRADVRSYDQTYGLVTRRTAHSDIVDIRPRARTYSQSVTGKPYFHQPSYSSCLLVIELCFSRNRIDDRSFFSIRGYGASKELHGGALWPE